MLTVRERNGRFQAIVRVKKNGVIVFQESRTFDTLRLANDWGKRLEQEVARTGVQARALATGTLADLIVRYRTSRDEVRPVGRTVGSDLDLLTRMLGSRSLDSLTSAVIVSFARERHAQGAGPATVLHNLATLRSVLGAAEPMFGVPVTPAPVVAAIKQLSLSGHVAKSQQRDRRPSQDELDELVSEFRRIANYPQTKIPMHTIVPLAVEFPRRVSELCSMRWADYATGVVVLRDTKHPRVVRTENVPVPPRAQEVIARLPRMDERILPYNSESVSTAFDRACSRLGIENLHLHDLRHEGICRLFEAGLSIPEVSLISGHMSWQTLKRYTHLSPAHVLEKLNARTQGQPEHPAEPAQPRARHRGDPSREDPDAR